MAAFATAYAPDGAPPLLVDCLTIPDLPPRIGPNPLSGYGSAATGSLRPPGDGQQPGRVIASVVPPRDPAPAAARRTVGVSPSRVAGAAPACAAERAARPAHRSCSGTARPGSAS